ncbi:type IV secretory system conjugative DNA transfer family protein [Erysipelothrix anatis]|uniref:type IV secretory system conjugative DNA transfer family protein n=1 Tax=Erysipelothrix anatis TaxID=2683713 RepID=UPI00140D31F4|nr:type IV secretion system DNA-binding domain-containing protein [Erysipelothrix anatis]
MDQFAKSMISILGSIGLPALVSAGILILIYLVYRYGGEFNLHIQYFYSRTAYTFYNFVFVYGVILVIIMFIMSGKLNLDTIANVYVDLWQNPEDKMIAMLGKGHQFQVWILSQWIFVCVTFIVYLQVWRTPKAELARSKRRDLRRMFGITLKKPNHDIDVNGAVIGTTGSGKTVEICNIVEEKLKKNQPIVLMDGKGDIDDYSMFDVVSKLAVKYKRPLYVINQTLTEDTDPYNPFVGCNATQVKDMLISMGDWSENASFYKSRAERYWQAMASYMIDFDIPLNFKNLIKLSNENEWSDEIMKNPMLEAEQSKVLSTGTRTMILNRFGERGLSEKRVDYLKIIIECGDSIQDNTASFSTVYEGEGRKLFEPMKNQRTFKMSDAIDANAVVIVLLNSMSYGSFAKSLGRLVVQDIKNALGQKMIKKVKEKALFIFDELGTYMDDEFVDISARARSIGGNVVYAMQGVSDMDIFSDVVRKQIINSCNFFAFFKQNDPDNATALSDILGTVENINTTSQVEDVGVARAGVGLGTNKITREYRFNPEMIKMLPKLRGIWFNKSNVHELPYIYKVKFVDTNGYVVPNRLQRRARRVDGEWASNLATH